ncbi:MAG: PilZ domain-containing protein [Desulfarculaceae bacterium]|jgi:hypothetical protein
MSPEKRKKAVRTLDLDQAFADFDLDRRKHGRVVPSPDVPVTLDIENQTVELQDISAGGCSFFFPEHLESGWLHQCRLQLPGQAGPFDLQLIIVRSDSTRLAHCRFEELSVKHFDLIQDYVLERQEDLLEQVIDPEEDDSILP